MTINRIKIIVLSLTMSVGIGWLLFQTNFWAGASATHLNLSAAFPRRVLATSPEAPFQLRIFTTAVKTDSRSHHYRPDERSS